MLLSRGINVVICTKRALIFADPPEIHPFHAATELLFLTSVPEAMPKSRHNAPAACLHMAREAICVKEEFWLEALEGKRSFLCVGMAVETWLENSVSVVQRRLLAYTNVGSAARHVFAALLAAKE